MKDKVCMEKGVYLRFDYDFQAFFAKKTIIVRIMLQ